MAEKYGELGDLPEPWRGARARGGNPWFRMKPSTEEQAGTVMGIATHLMNIDRFRTDRLERYFKLYGGTRLIGIRPWETPMMVVPATTANRSVQDALRLNVCKAAVDTITSKVGKLRPRPTFVTDHGDWSLQLKARNLQRFIDGAYHQADVYELASNVFRDAMIFGTGVLHPHHEAGKLCAERVPAWEMFVDPADGLYGTPRCIYRVKWISLDAARALPGYDPTIGPWTKGSAESEGASITADAFREGFVRVVEAWALAVPGVEAGCHVLIAGNQVIEHGRWDDCEFPFVFVHWSKPIQGFWGDSAIQEVVGIQVEINKLLQSAQQSMQLVGQPWVLRREDAILRPGKLKNLPGMEIIVDKGIGTLDEALKVVTFAPVHPQIYTHIWALYAKAFEILGSNQLAASATAPAGLESGRALEALSDEHSERFMTVSRHFEWCIGNALARQFIRLAKELDSETPGGYSLHAPGRGKQSLKLKWADVAINSDGFMLQVWAESVLPSNPAARTQHVKDLADQQWISREEARRLLRFPDLDAEDDLATADEDNLHRQLADMLEDGKAVMPEPYQNLERALTLGQQAILRAMADRVPEGRIALVRDFLAAVEAMLARADQATSAAAAPAGAPALPPGVVPPGVPAPPPGA